MKIVVSPAKSLDFETPLPTAKSSQISFTAETEKLNSVLQKKSSKNLMELMKISQNLGDLNRARNLGRTNEYTSENARQAVFAFKGDVYIGLDAYSLNETQIDNLQNKLRILSGLYGLLKPLDLIQPYRLEMGTKLKVGAKPNLYTFWDKKISQALNDEMEEGEALINLASKEYFSAVKPELLKGTVITPVFKDYIKGNLKIVSFHAKKARGMMTRFIIDKEIETTEDLKTFNYGNYEFDVKLSTEKELVFVR